MLQPRADLGNASGSFGNVAGLARFAHDRRHVLHGEPDSARFAWRTAAACAASSRQDGTPSKPLAIATSVEHTEDLHQLVVGAEIDEMRKSLEHDPPKIAVRNRERARRLEGARERRVDLVDELAPKANALGFVPSECLVDVRFRLAEDEEITSNRECAPSPRTSY